MQCGPRGTRLISEEISHYRIIKKLGAGGMGEVYLAEDIKLNRKVAIKMLPSRSIGNEQAKKRLLREAQAAATLDHPNICAIHEVGEEGDSAFIVMQYVEGSTLSKAIKDNPLPPSEVVDIGIQAAAALAEAHSHGIIHRDIKPQNMILTPRGQVKVLDFGLAKIVQDEQAILTASPTESRLTDTGEIVGTVGYMSPEQLKDLPVDTRSDLFSLGVTLYECATGKSTFSGSSKIQISLQVIQFDPPKPSQLNPDIPIALDEIILKAIAKDVAARYQSADEMRADLSELRAAIADGSAYNTRQLTPMPGSSGRRAPASLPRRIRDIPLRVKIGLLVILIAVGIFAAINIRRPSAREPSPDAKTWYDRGTEAIRWGAYYQASKALQKSVQFDDGFALAHARLAEAYAETDYSEKAKEELLRAIALAPDRSSLPGLGGIYLDAIQATVGRDFAVAIKKYSEIASQASGPEKASAYVDLGRSYEKNENIDKAIQYYVEATRTDTQSAAAFLRLGILYARRQDFKNASDAFDSAERIYQTALDQEGSAEVWYQRGVLKGRLRQLAAAKTELEKSLEVSRRQENSFQTVRTLLQLGSIYDVEGDAGKAHSLVKEAVDLAQSKGIRNLATNGLLDLGNTLLSRGELDEASKYFNQALGYAQEDRAQRTEAKAKYLLGSLNLKQGNIDEAISLLGEALTFFREGDYKVETSNALLLTARAHRVKGEYEIALQTFNQQLDIAKDLDDPARIAASHSSIAFALGELERYTDALSNVEESYRIDAALNASVDKGTDQMNRASFLWRLGRYQEAATALEAARSIAAGTDEQQKSSYKTLLGWVNLTDSQRALSQLRYSEAIAKCQEALDIATTQKIKDLACPAKYTIALAQASSGKAQSAQKLCEEAVEIAREVKSPRLLSSALLAQAQVLLLRNDAKGALGRASEAQQMFAQAKQADSEWQAWAVAARANQGLGNKSAAQECASRVDDLLGGLHRNWGQEAYDSYLRRPDIQNLRSHLAMILNRSK
jgi:serine/threonine protein kinase/Tfp pilus assembly protein PilF